MLPGMSNRKRSLLPLKLPGSQPLGPLEAHVLPVEAHVPPKPLGPLEAHVLPVETCVPPKPQ